MSCFSIRVLHHAVSIHSHGGAALVHGMGEEIAHDLVVNPLAYRILAAGHDDGVRTTAVVFHVDVGDEAARVAVGRLGTVDVHDGAVVVQLEQLPGAAVMIRGPAPIEHMGEAEEAVRWRGGSCALPGLGVVTWAGEHYHPVHLLMHGKTRRRGAAVRDAAHDDLLPAQAATVWSEELLPPSVRILLRQPLHELQRAFHHAVRLRDVHQWAEILSRGCFEADLPDRRAAAVLVLSLGEACEPAVRVMWLDAVIAKAGDALKQPLIVPHEPDHELALRRHPRVHHSVLKICGLPFVIGKGELDLGMFLGLGINLAGPLGEIVTLGLGGLQMAAEEEHGDDEVFHGVFHCQLLFPVHFSFRSHTPGIACLNKSGPLILIR